MPGTPPPPPPVYRPTQPSAAGGGWTAPQPQGAPPPQPIPQPPAGPTKLNGFAIASLVCALAPVVLGGLPALAAPDSPDLAGVFGTVGVVGLVLGIVFGFVALSQIKNNPGVYHGRGLAIAGITISIVLIALAVIAIILVMIFVAALAAACAGAFGSSSSSSSGSGSSCAVPLALVAAKAGERKGWGKFLLAHHPSCEHYEKDVLRIAGVRFCLGCVTTSSVVFGAVLLLQLTFPPLAWTTWIGLGFALGAIQFLAVFGFTKARGVKIAVKVALGLGLAALMHGVLLAPWSWPVRIAFLATGWLLATVLMWPRGRRIAREAEAHGHGILA